MDYNNYGLIFVSVLTVILIHIPINHVNCQSLTVCKYLDATAVINYANQDVNTVALFHWTSSEMGTYFTLTTSGSIYLDDTRISVTFNVFNLGNGTIETLVIQAMTIYGDTVGEWTQDLDGLVTNCDTTTKNTIYHFGSVPRVAPSYQFIARSIEGLTMFFRATVKVKVPENGVNKEYFYYGVQSDQIFPVFPSPCNDVPCHNQGTCIVIGTTFKCECTPEWTGPQCEVKSQPSPCDPSPCANGGSCRELSDILFSCECPAVWTGILCDVPSSPCDSSPCLNGAICNEDASSYTCICMSGWTGDRCQHKTPCSPNPCSNSGFCNIVNEDEFTCSCREGYHGDTCLISIIPTPTASITHASCTNDTCKNGGECQGNPASGYQCHCQDRFQGQHCELKVPDDPCVPNPCFNDGECFSSPDSKLLCRCSPSWRGTLCDQESVGGTSMTVIIGSTVGCLSFLIITITILLIIRYFYKRRNRLTKHRRSDVEPIYFNSTQHVPGTLRPGVFSSNNNEIGIGGLQNDGINFDNAGYQHTAVLPAVGHELNTVTLNQPAEDRFYESRISNV